MFLLRRAALRAASAPVPFVTRPRTFATFAPSVVRPRQQWSASTIQKRFASDEARPSEATVTDETVTESPSQSEQETSAEYGSTQEPTSADSQDQSTVGSAMSSAAETTQNALSAAAQSASNAFSNASPEESSTTLYIGNLFYEVKEDSLRQEFQRFGTIAKTTVARDPSGLSRGFGYVEFESPEAAENARQTMNQRVFEGRRMSVQFHRRREGAAERTFKSNPPSKTLFIGNLSFEMSDKDLNDLFRDIRNVLDVRVAIDRRTGAPRGFAHADFIDETSATKAKEVLENKEVYGRKLRIDYSTSVVRR
ncbi:uncharacterized protein K452DRAFT_314871 [Aplosporella prunicola CBS 121167]|uniref:RRM domain-containing protein n=1 Tax=Aplosporella prunicola CBS 121167 TaxID=1176127 RepID=A0A6A6BTT0_9PEZI|nr:uncharacterized protein K452DRAFT_314871 [Aplosporella prunicola CBS 121167]KAF2146624.1 hypothetical protein K452DRAFT_314871 [Aplosporella prunicola CBS 121167]